MKRVLFAIWLIAFFTFPLSAQVVQPCVVKRYNQKQQKTPLEDVQVIVENAGHAVSDTNGKLTLTFRTSKPGDKVTGVVVDKPGYELFNTDAVNQWFLSRHGESFEIILVDSYYFTRYKNALRQTSTDSYKKKYETTLRELENQKTAGAIQKEAFEKRLSELDKWYYEQLNNLKGYIDVFARIDLSEVSEQEQSILEMVEQGKIEEALKAYEELGLSDKLRSEADRFSNLTAKIRFYEKEREQAKQSFADLYAAFQRHISTLILSGHDREVKERLTAMIEDIEAQYNKEPSTFQPYLAELNWQLGDYILKTDWDRDNYSQAIDYLQIAEKQYALLTKKGLSRFRPLLAQAQTSLGLAFTETEDEQEAEKKFLDALTNWQRVLEKDANNDEWRGYLAFVQHQLGIVYLDKYENDVFEILFEPDLRDTSANNVKRILQFKTTAEGYFADAFENFNLVIPSNSDKYLLALADAQEDLGHFYITFSEYSKAESLFMTVYHNMEDVFSKKDSNVFAEKMISSLYWLSEIYRCSDHQKEKQELCLRSAFDICSQNLASSVDYAYPYQTTLENLSAFYYSHDTQKQKELLETANAECNQVFQQKALVRYRYLRDHVSDMLSRYYHEKKLYDKEEILYRRTLDVYTPKSLVDPEPYAACLFHTYYQLQELYRSTRANDKLEKSLLEEIALWEQFRQISEKYLTDLAVSYISLGDFYWKEKVYDKVVDPYQKALEIAEGPSIPKWLKSDMDLIRRRVKYLEDN